MATPIFLPGPWLIKDLDGHNPELTIVHVASGGVELAICELEWNRATLKLDRANARLIASAPEMFELLNEALRGFAAIGDSDRWFRCAKVLDYINDV